MCLLWAGVVMCWSRGGGTLRLRAGLLPGTSSSGSGRPQEEGLPVSPFLSFFLWFAFLAVRAMRKPAEHTECYPAGNQFHRCHRLMPTPSFAVGLSPWTCFCLKVYRLVNCDAWSGMKRGTLMIDTTHCLSFSSGSHFEERVSRRPIQSQPPPLSTSGTRMDEEGWGGHRHAQEWLAGAVELLSARVSTRNTHWPYPNTIPVSSLSEYMLQ